MGCDGGTIPRRDELVRLKKKQETKDKDAERAFQWRCCQLSQQVLQSPIVMCGLGYIYNKVAVIEALLNRDSVGEQIRHIKSLKDVKTLNFTSNVDFNVNSNKTDGAIDHRVSPYICPVTGIEISGQHRFVALWSCGCVFSERALKEVATNICHKCQQPFVNEDVVVLNGNEEDVAKMRINMENRKQKNKRVKKIKIEAKEETSTSIEHGLKEGTTAEIKKETPATSILDGAEGKPSTSKLVVKTVGGLLQNKRASDDSLQTKAKKVKKDYSIAKDPNASEVYKSLFTTHASEQQQTRAHWITYNPFYN